MKKEYFYLLYYSGMDRNDFDPLWYGQNEKFFCKTCHRQKNFESSLDVIVDGDIRELTDMPFIGLIPGIMSRRILDWLGSDADIYLNIGKVFSQMGGVRKEQPYFSFTAKRPYIVLRGKNPDVLMGRPIPEDERIYICPECGFKSRRERRPFFLLKSERPGDPISCADLGLLIHQSVYEKIDQTKLKKVRVEKVEIVNE
ncbi:hypothetical protein [Burkholderia sp. Ac-20349]|uniref:hypothetical protein n=1 Tax=Burkholderia sp. Ac-20349 TaxID=2703893 RepID=UPI00197BC622|nr:hypothetical protein [Burkholderia sp. Ac-20349]MBN3839453.1 hypothetical protein [Burkholderia sp. Ac-20349]